MSAVRASVEWVFGRIKTLFAFVDFSKNLRVMHGPEGMDFPVAGLLTNVHCCVNEGNQISDMFDIKPPSLTEYLE